MADISLRPVHAQNHRFDHKLTPDIRLIQELTLLHQHQLEQRIDHELSHNPALEFETEPDILEQLEPKESDDDWNEDFDKPIDEYETGDSSASQENESWEFFDISSKLEQAVIQRFSEYPDRVEQALQHIDYYRIHGGLPDNADPQLYQDLAVLENSISYQTLPPIHPTFEVMVEGDRVEANVVPIGLNLRHVQGLGSLSTQARRFIQAFHDRNRLLNDFAHFILEILQGDFFRQHDLDTALRYLLPVPVQAVSTNLKEKFPFTIDKKYLSKIGDYLVSCCLGTFPLNFFLPTKAHIVRFWAHFATENGKVTINDQLDWIRSQMKKRTEKWDSNDVRYGFVSPLKNIKIDDIKYAHRFHSKTLNQ